MFSRVSKAKSEAALSSELTEITDSTAPGATPIPKTSAKASAKKPIARASVIPSIISSDVVIKGSVQADGEIQLDGTLEGDVSAQRLVIGESAIVRGEVVAGSVRVSGTVEGSIRADTVELFACAHVQGDIVHSALSIETGARFDGNCGYSENPRSDHMSSTPDAPAGSEQSDDVGRSPVLPVPAPEAELETANDSALTDKKVPNDNVAGLPAAVKMLDTSGSHSAGSEGTQQAEIMPVAADDRISPSAQEDPPVQLKSSLGRVNGSLMKRHGQGKPLR